MFNFSSTKGNKFVTYKHSKICISVFKFSLNSRFLAHGLK